MSWVKIPITNRPYSTQTFKVTLGKRNASIKLKLRYMDLAGHWLATVIDNATGECVIDCMPLVCGADLLGQHRHLGLGSAYIVPATETDLMMPDEHTLGTTFILVWGDDS